MHNSSDHFLIGAAQGYSPAIADLVSMMNYARATTLQTVAGLSVAQLDHLHDAESNSIGTLLFHMAAAETVYSIITFLGREPTKEDLAAWDVALNMGAPAREQIRGNDQAFYLDKLAEVRRNTLREFAVRDDAWLRTQVEFRPGQPANYFFMWFHVCEDEINHRGQIRWLRKRLPK